MLIQESKLDGEYLMLSTKDLVDEHFWYVTAILKHFDSIVNHGNPFEVKYVPCSMETLKGLIGNFEYFQKSGILNGEFYYLVYKDDWNIVPYNIAYKRNDINSGLTKVHKGGVPIGDRIKNGLEYVVELKFNFNDSNNDKKILLTIYDVRGMI